MILYITNCPGGSCSLKKEDVGKVKHKLPSGRISTRDGCSKHKGVVIQRKSICGRCKKSFYSSLKGKVAENCKPCSDIIQRKIMRDAHRKVAAAKKAHAATKAREKKSCGMNWICGGFCIKPFFHCRASGGY